MYYLVESLVFRQYNDYVTDINTTLKLIVIKVGFSASLTLMAIFFANVSLKYGYVYIILDFLPRSTKKEYLFLKYR